MTDHAVVDTNVLVAANGRGTHVEIGCQLRCVEELARLTDQEVVCVDDKRLILNEYQRRSTSRGQKGPGTAFYIHIHQHMYNANRVRCVPVEPVDAEGRGFSDPVLPANNLKKDAKFLAVAVKANATIVNAADSDWDEHRDLTDRLGVRVRQLCPHYVTRS